MHGGTIWVIVFMHFYTIFMLPTANKGGLRNNETVMSDLKKN